MIQLATSDEPPAARNGVVRPVSGMTRVTPPITMKHCRATVNERPDGEQLAEVVLSREADAQAARDEQEVQREDGEEAGETELLADARDDVVALRDRGDPGLALAEPGADQAAVRQPEEALHELVAAARARRRRCEENGLSQFANRSCT